MAKLQKKSIGNSQDIWAVLARFWGYPGFRPLQEEIILSVLDGRDTLALMPTGGGKSLTFQVPAMAKQGICLVVTPLIALMKDQVEQLRGRNIKAAAIHSGMTRSEIAIALDNCVFGDYKFLYVSPERLRTDLFRARVRDMPVNLLAVDEAHCISQWGYDFRPSYLDIRKVREELDGVPVLALTATATPEVCRDIMEQLGFSEKNLLSKSFDRPNLAYVVRRTSGKERELVEIARKMNSCGIVYTRNRKKCRELAELLRQEGIPASFYHAGLKQEDRDERQKDWGENRVRVMVATNAFGMGIDKPDVRFVIHADLPDTPEAYFQEAGRAGRDGQKAWAVLLSGPADARMAEQRISVNFPGIPRIKQVYHALGNYLQIPQGSGKGQQYDFELGNFLHQYHFNSLVVHSSLRMLEREGYLALSDAFNNPSRIRFLAGRDDLYHFQVKNAEFDAFIKLLLRSYTGLFTTYVKIDESDLARRSGLGRQKVYDYLVALSERQIISYIPRKTVPVITYLEERLDERNLYIDPGRYRFRKERYEKRLRALLRYAASTDTCRNKYLLAYFGELNTAECGRCDVCLEKRKDRQGRPEEPGLRDSILEVLKEKGRGLEELVDNLGRDPELVVPIVERMIDEGLVARGDDMKIVLKEGF